MKRDVICWALVAKWIVLLLLQLFSAGVSVDTLWLCSLQRLKHRVARCTNNLAVFASSPPPYYLLFLWWSVTCLECWKTLGENKLRCRTPPTTSPIPSKTFVVCVWRLSPIKRELASEFSLLSLINLLHT